MATYASIRYQPGAGSSGSGTTVYSTTGDLPVSGNSAGDQAYVSGNNRLYIWNGTGWYNIALINATPSISGANSSYAFATDGTAITVTITAADPEGLPITYSVASDTSGNIATVAQGTGASTNVWTITPSTNTAHAGTFSLTFRASDGINLATAVSSFTLAFSVANSNYTTALITSVGANNATNASFDDKSSGNYTLTAAGDAHQTTFSPYRHGGYSTFFDGVGDYIDWPAHADFNLAAGSFTIEGWINTTISSNDTYYRRIFMLDGPTGNNNSNIQLAFDGANGKFNMWSNSGAVDVLSGTGFNDGAWHHFAVVRNSNTLTLWIDGSSAGTADASSYTFSPNSGTPRPRIGSYNQSLGDFQGFIRDFRIVKGTAVYTSAFNSSLPDAPLTAITNTSLLTCHLPYISDGSTTGHAPTVGGSISTRPFAPYDYETYSVAANSGSAHFDGSGDTISTATIDLTLAADFTIEFWIYPKVGAAQGYGAILWGNTQSDPGIFVGYNNAGKIRFTNWSATPLTSATSPLAGQWTHVAIVRNGSGSNNLKMYFNGVQDAQATNTATHGRSDSYEIGESGGYHYTGNIADLRVVKGTAIYTSAFTPPTAPLTAVTNTELLVQSTDAGIIDKSQSVQRVTLNGDIKSSTTQSKYLTSSMYFDGTGDYVSAPYSSLFDLGTKDFTVELWARFSANSGVIPLVGLGQGGSGASTVGWSLQQHATYGGLTWYRYNGSTETYYTKSWSPSTNTWYHVAVSRQGTDLRFFIDGTSIGTQASVSTSYNNINTSDDLWIGRNRTGGGSTYLHFNGYMSDLRVTKGLARYTSNFTAPTTALTG